jgi:fatty-acid peroxygenase
LNELLFSATLSLFSIQKVALLSGIEGARLFYENECMKRSGSMPSNILKRLFGEGGVQGLNGKVHNHRKLILMYLMTS